MAQQLVPEVKFAVSRLVSVSKSLCELSKFRPSAEFSLKFCGTVVVRASAEFVAEFCARMEFCAELLISVQVGSGAEILPEL